MKTIWDDLYDEEMLSNINAKLRRAQSIADRQAFGMVRKVNTEEFIKVMADARDDINSILTRVEAMRGQGL